MPRVEVKRLTEGMDKRTARYKKTVAYLEARARPGERKTVTVKHMGDKNAGVPETVTLTAGKCPCSICGHEWMWECEEQDCVCCSSVCT